MARTGYRDILASLRGRLVAGELSPGDRLPTEVELARQFSVNRFTVRRALAHLEKDGKVIRRRGSGTYVAPRHERGLSILYVGELESHFHKELYLALSSVAQRRGHQFFGIEPPAAQLKPDQRASLLERINEANWIIIAAQYLRVISKLAPGHTSRMIVIGYRPVAPHLPPFTVLLDRFNATRIAFNHLASLGHQRIALITTGYDMEPDHDPPRIINDAYLGFQSAILATGLHRCTVVRVPNTEEDKTLFRQLLTQPARQRPTAILCDADFRARRLYQVAAQLNRRIPNDLSVIGIADTPWCDAMTPELTSVNLGEKELARLVIAMSESGPPETPLSCHITPRLVPRHSCAPAR